MNYEVVYLNEKILVGLNKRVNMNDPNMGEIIGSMWEKLYQGGINQKINNKINEYAIGLYSDYEKDSYLVSVGNEVSKNENKDLDSKIIPAGKYAKFSIEGHMVDAVVEAWEKIWEMDLDRSYTGDFEEYLNADWENAKIDIYIALK